MERYQHKDRFPNIVWNKAEVMTDQELVALAAKCLLMNPQFQLGTWFNEDSWCTVGTARMTTAEADRWKQTDLQVFCRENRSPDTNRRVQAFVSWLRNKRAIHPKEFDPSQPFWEVTAEYIDNLLEAIENPGALAGKIFGSCWELDKLVSVEQGHIMYDAYKRQGAETKLVILEGYIPGGGSGMGPAHSTPGEEVPIISPDEAPQISRPIILDFFIEYLVGR